MKWTLLAATLVSSFLIYCGSSANAKEGSQTPSGLAILALLNPRFPVNDAYKVISASPAPAFAFVHKTFGNSYKNLDLLLSKLLANPVHARSNITVLVYGDCGPCRPPRRPAGLFPLIAPKETISSLNRKLEKNDHRLVRQFEKEYAILVGHLPINERLKYHFQISLEDNLSEKAFLRLANIAHKAIAGRDDITLGRNPQAHRRTPGFPTERHSYGVKDLYALKPGDVLTGDGAALAFPGERCANQYSTQQVRQVVLAARARGVIFLLWRPEHQGIPFCPNRIAFIPPSKRTYKISNKAVLKRLLK